MNSIRQIQALNKRELENAVPPEASWHADYRDTAYIYIGGLPYELSEGDIITIFSQFGEPVHVNLVRDKETGKSRGFAFLKYEDQRSTDLAVDNFCGATVMGRMLRVDHVRYKRREEEGEEDNVAVMTGQAIEGARRDDDTDTERRERRSRDTRRHSHDSDVEDQGRPLLKEEKELAELMRNYDDEDPMKEYLIQEKKEEVARALEKLKSKRSSRRRDDSRERSHRHRHRHHHRRRHSEDRSRSRERSRRDRDMSPSNDKPLKERSQSPPRTSHRDRSSSRNRTYKDRSRSRDKSHRDRARSRDKTYRDRSLSRDRSYKDRSRSRDRSYRDRSQTRSQSPDHRQERRRRDRDR
ncbi:hypothetical protein VTN77DRAFT_2865 [Rasamsonia byssochlamydoides]|uniref:uncharacterized protein n=1 Tax=Rasamsonia byssochlamydoides TaxID=89139 RepID=UPI00374332D9